MNTMIRITKKEFGTFFSSHAAYLFLGVFLAANLFIFFWLESFFARNIADLQPLFQWMPVLLIFLCSAITMRMWAEERRRGTEELLLTSPVSYLTIIGGKFVACLALVAVALILSFPLAVTVNFIGPLDWGPVFGGYIAALFLAGAYISIGLFVSSRSDNQLVALISSVVVCAVFYFIGSSVITGFFNNSTSEFLQLLGSGSRFDSITRGVIDIRDLFYYLSIAGIFLALTIYSVEQQRWAGNSARPAHRRWLVLASLLTGNLLVLNIWLAPIQQVRIDLTENRLYSLSDATKNYLAQLREPLLIRGYFSAQTHPLLAPLVPGLRDLLKEYQVAGNGKVRIEIIDPGENPELEQEAAEKYGIRPVPFRSSSRYQTAITNSYFNILVSYGNEFQTLGFRDLIDIQSQSENDLNVALKNPEYDISQAIKKVLYSYQSSGNLFDNITSPVSFTGYFSADSELPKELVELKTTIQDALEDMDKKSQGHFSHSFVDPDRKGKAFVQKLQQDWGFQPMAASLLSTKRFWFYMVMNSGNQSVQVPLPSDLSSAGIERSLQSALKRFSTGFLKTVALVEPPSTPPIPQYGMPGRGPKFRQLHAVLSEDHSVIDTDLKDGQVPENADILLVVAPEKMNSKQVFAIDQFLMRGGTVITSTSPFELNLQGSLSVQEHTSGLEDWLAFQGLNIDKKMVLDTQNAPFPVPVRRNLGGIEIQETKLVKYPFFVDFRLDGMDQDSGMLRGINQLTFNWGSPILIDKEKNGKRRVIKLLQSSNDSWSTADLNIQPNFQRFGNLGFEVGEDTGAVPLAVMVEGSFTSWFKDKPSPLSEETGKDKEAATGQGEKGKEGSKPPVIDRLIDHSPDSSRLIVLASNNFLTDVSLDLATSVNGTQYRTPVQLVANFIDWSLEDRSLLAMRNQTRYSRTLLPLQNSQRQFIEYMNYALAVLGLVMVWGIGMFIRRRSRIHYQAILDTGRIM